LGLIDRARERLFAKVSGEPQELKDAKDQTEEDKAVCSFVRGKLEECRSFGARIAQEGINLTNIAYLCGFDAVFFDSTSRSFKPIASPSRLLKQNRVHVNRILPTVQNRLARLVKNPPRYDVRPKSGDEEDKDAARLGEHVLEQLWEQLAINRKRIPMTMWLQQCGSAYFKVVWDQSLGKKRVVPKPKVEGQEPVEGADLYEIVAEGDMRVDVCSFFEVFPDPLAKSWDEIRYLIHAKIRPLDYFPSQYQERGSLVKEEDCWLNSLTYEQRINSINTTTGAGAVSAQLKNSAIEMSYYEKPSSKHPYGRHLIVANGVKLKDDVLPVDELPFVKFDDIVVGGKFNAESIITHLRPLQDQINRGKTMRAAWLNRTLTGKILVPRGANLSRESFNDQSGEILEYDKLPEGGGEPKAMEAPAIPQYAYQEEDTLKLDMDDTAGINQASRGQMPSASIPAIGMQLLVEQDDTRIGVETEQHEHSYADLGRILLKFVGEYYETDRLLKIAGQNMEYTVRKFKGADLRDNFDVHVIRGSTLPGSKVLKRQEIMNLHQQGYFGNPTDPLVTQNVLSMLEYGDEYQAWKRHSLRMAQIQRGIRMIEELHEKPPVSEFDDHSLWLQELDDYRISDKYLKLEDDQRQMVLTTMNEHTDWLQQLTQPIPDPDTDPSLRPTTAAQDNEQQLLNQAPPQETGGPEADMAMANAQATQLEQ
jgi:hypothetical protein